MLLITSHSSLITFPSVPVAQPDRASDFGSEGWGFESLQARGLSKVKTTDFADVTDQVLSVFYAQYPMSSFSGRARYSAAYPPEGASA